MSIAPLVSVVMPAFNAGKYIHTSISSVLAQSYDNIELIIINDGSSDNTLQVAQSFSDKRIRIINIVENRGIVYALNTGLKVARGKYIARMDADDYCYKDRIKLQVDFLEKNSDIVILGGGHRIVSENNMVLTKQYFPLRYEYIIAEAIFNSPFSHITVMFRSDYVKKNKVEYQDKHKAAEDYELWVRVIEKSRVANIPYILADYRVNREGQTSKHSKDQEGRYQIISSLHERSLKRLKYSWKYEELRLHYMLSLSDHIRSMEINNQIIKDIRKHFNKILTLNRSRKAYNAKALKCVLGRIWLKVFVFNFYKMNFFQKLVFLSNKFLFYGLVYQTYLKIVYEGASRYRQFRRWRS